MERFKNVLEQARPGGSNVITYLCQLEDKEVLDNTAKLVAEGKLGVTPEMTIRTMLHWKQEDTATYEARFHNMDEILELLNRELLIILVQKTKIEVYEKVNSAETGEGLFAFVRLNDWFSKTTELGEKKQSHCPNQTCTMQTRLGSRNSG